MRLTDLLTQERVAIRHATSDGQPAFDKAAALAVLAELLAGGARADSGEVRRVLAEREQLQSTGIGDGVAIPHGALPRLDAQCAALLVVPEGVDFAAIDGVKVNLLFAVIGPKRATGEHLKTLARISRLLRNKEFRERLVGAADSKSAYELIDHEEGPRT
jgi:PTS system nitrogen regulatory IIA component